MKHFKKFLLPLLLAVFSTTFVFTETSNNFAIQISDLLDTVNQKDLWAVRDWLKTKRVSLNNKLGDFSISGDIRTQWRNLYQHANGVNITNGPGSPSTWTNNLFTIDFRLYFDYKSDKTWASVKLDFDQAAGLFQGQANNLALVRANMGYHLFDDGNMKLDVMLGRQRAYELYDSQVQFNSTLDGFTGIYGVSIESLANLSIRGGGYIFNATSSHPVWVVQAGVYDFLDSGFYFEYAFVNWSKNTSSTAVNNTIIPIATRIGSEAWAFRNNQFILGYNFNPELFSRDVSLYGGILWNALARPLVIQRLSGNVTESCQNLAGWLALQIGSVQKAGDWAFQAQWQVVEAYAVPDWDIAGIGRGNGSDSGLFGPTQFTKSRAPSLTGNGNANYNGWALDLLYSVTNELVLEATLQRALGKNSSIGGKSSYTNFTLSAIYGF